MKVTEQFEFDASRTGPELSLLADWPHAAREVLVVATMSFCPAALGSGGPTTKPQWRTVACASFAEVYRLARRGQIAVLVVPADVDPGELSALRTTFPPRYGVLVGPLGEGPGLFAGAAALKAEGYIACPEDLGGALRDMAEQACPMPPAMRRWLLEHHPVVAKDDKLTSREREVLELLVAGAANKAIGQALALSESSVREHVKRILWKMGAKNRTEAATQALRQGLVL